MPCNIGYKNIAKVIIPAVMPQEFKEKVKPPEIDQELLDKIGEDDQAFVEWVKEFDIKPLLKEALKRMADKVRGSGALKFFINESGYLAMSGSFKFADEKKKLEALSTLVSNQFQMEVLAIVAELMDYQISMSQSSAGEEIIIEGEKETGSGVHKYLKITKDKNGSGVIMFEHFESKKTLTSEQQKFMALAQKLGIKIVIKDAEQSGQPIPQGAEHKDFLKEG